VYIPDVVGNIFQFGRTTALVAVSEDGTDPPLVYAYTDVLDSYAGNSSFNPSHIVQIDGKNTTDFLLDWSHHGGHQDKDALWNDIFYSNAQASLGGLGSGPGTFTGNGRGRIVYPGPTTTLTFANGSTIINENFARVLVNLRNIESGSDMYHKFLVPQLEDHRNVSEVFKERGEKENRTMRAPYDTGFFRHPHTHETDDALSSQRRNRTVPAMGYPSPIVRHTMNENGGYFLEGPEFEDVAILTVGSFANGPMPQTYFQKINSDFIAAALAAEKTKLIIDVSANGGGIILQGYDLFKQLFPSIHPYGATRLRTVGDDTYHLGRIYSSSFNSSDSTLAQIMDQSMFNYRNDLDSDDKKFTSFEQKYGHHRSSPAQDHFTSLIRWDLNDPRISQYGGMSVTGYGKRSNITSQPFHSQNIILVTDGFCASTCAILSEFLRQEAGVQTISLGGRPAMHAMQAVGGTKGTTMFPWEQIYAYTHDGDKISREILHDGPSATGLNKYSSLPLARAAHASVNARDGIRRNDSEQTPYQFLYEPAHCRIFYTKQMVMDQSAVWKTVADTVWGDGNACIASDDSFSGRQGNITAGSEAKRPKVWSVRPDFDINEAREGLSVETYSDWSGGHGDCVMVR